MRLSLKFKTHILAGGVLAGIIGLSAVSPAQALSLRQAVSIAVKSNPEIGEAIANRQALEFELRQGRGLFLPSIDLEARGDAQVIDNSTTRTNNDRNHTFFRRETSATVSQLLFDGFKAASEVERQAARVDGASHRVWERSEFIGLAVVREYLTIMLRRRIINITQQNVGYHTTILGDLKEGEKSGTITVADRQQAQERLFAARARVAEAREEYQTSLIGFHKLVGKPAGHLTPPRGIRVRLPRNLDHAIGYARKNNPQIHIQKAAIDTAYALLRAAESKFYPDVRLEGRARAGKDLDGVRGRETDLRAGVVVRWNIYRGGIDVADRQEQIRRIDEERLKLHRIHREVEEGVRLSWTRLVQQRARAAALAQQVGASTSLVGSYREQFGVGRRSLLDLLDSQNTRFSSQVALATARTAVQFAEYRVLAAMGKLLRTFGLKPPADAHAYARDAANVPKTPAAETMSRHEPHRPVKKVIRHAPKRAVTKRAVTKRHAPKR